MTPRLKYFQGGALLPLRNRKLFYGILTLILVLLLVVAGCSSSSPSGNGAPTDNGAPPSNGTSSQPEPSAEPLAGLNLVDEPLATKRLDVELVYSGTTEPALCYLGSYAMLAKYNDNSLDFPDVVANSGMANSAIYYSGVNILSEGLFLWGVGLAAINQGFDYYIAAQEGAVIADDTMSKDLPEEAEEVVWLESEEELFTLLKRLISSDIPVEVHLDCTNIQQELVTYTSYWEVIFEFTQTYLNKDNDHYFVVTGYDQDFVYLNDPTEPQAGMGKDIPVTTEHFLEAWANGNHPSFELGAGIGPYWMFFLGERSTPKTAEQVLAWNRDFAVSAPDEIRAASVDPFVDSLMHCGNMCRERLDFGEYLQRNGYTAAGELYIEAGELFGELCYSDDQTADMLEIANLLEQALDEW
jgi:hypothetical protein